jgi:small-conductance mechanosensitive channel
MILNAEELDVMIQVRANLMSEQSKDYICIEVMHHTTYAMQRELGRWKNRILFWRRYDIREKWKNRREKLISAISFGLRMHPTMGEWLHAETYEKGIKFPNDLRNKTLYMLARLAWLDKIIETGRIQ